MQFPRIIDEPCASEPKMEVSKTQDFTAFSESCTSVSEEKVMDAKDSSVATESFLKTQDVNVISMSDTGTVDGCGTK